MSTRMKIMIAYDGSSYADAAIDDLRRAGLPSNGEALIVSVAGVSESSVETSYEIGIFGRFVSTRLLEETIALTHKENARARNEAIELATQGGQRVQAVLPNWRVRNQIALGNPAEELLKKADEFKPDLIVLGSNGRSAIGRFFLGSVSQQVAEKANCSVRVVRKGDEKESSTSNRVVIGASSLPDAEEIIRAVAARSWENDTELRLVVADDGISAGRVSAVYPYAKAIFEQAVEELRERQINVAVEIRTGATEFVLLDEAENWQADAIFIADEKSYEEVGLGNLAENLINHAKCTVEVVRYGSFQQRIFE